MGLEEDSIWSITTPIRFQNPCSLKSFLQGQLLPNISEALKLPILTTFSSDHISIQPKGATSLIWAFPLGKYKKTIDCF